MNGSVKNTDISLLEERVHADLELITRNQFLAIVSHDLKNSVVAISIRARLMRKSLSKGDEWMQSVFSKILELLSRPPTGMDRMINDLLDVERMAHGKLHLKPERVDLRALIQECMDLFAPIVASKSFSMTSHIPSEPIFADVDHDRILQVLSNLIGNSLKFTPNGGTIELSARKQETEVEISVTDNGPGIPEQAKAKFLKSSRSLK